ncbi:muscle M-line assembly protein unc-89 isoform X2 [Euwallacea similis]|uniref:muscle M-line assembly protein unc-89 isoform X2 n=1 Tax=Euwallacea similis TaxID=1736056 RepID=UPI00344D5171
MMQEPGDTSITVVEPHVETYAESNLNEKNIGTQYIYTTEGQLIPANDQASTMDLSSQTYSTTHVTEAQNIHIQQVDYQYEQQYGDDNAQQVVNQTEYVSNSTTYVMEPATYAPETNQEKAITEQQTYSSETTTYTYFTATSNEGETNYASSPTPPSGALSADPLNNSEKEADKIDNGVTQHKVAEEQKEPATESVSIILERELESNPAVEIENADNIEQIDETAVNQEIEESEMVEETIEEMETVDTTGSSKEDVGDVNSSQEIGEIVAETGVSAPRPRGRKPKSDIPLHILGRDVNKPVENFVNGKTLKPRLGVKVPYRNLTSQIVSKAEIEKEIIERGKKKQDEKKDISFSRQLTSRLTQKIAPDKKNSKAKSSRKADSSSTKVSDDEEMEVDSNGNENSEKKASVAIDNDSDLLAILEGDGDSEEISTLNPQNKESTPSDETNLKNLEREIALQQLQDLPYLSPKTKYVKSNKHKMYSKERVSSTSEGKVSSSTDKLVPSTKPQGPKNPIKANALKFDEPQIKVNVALKTYSRKRKSSEGVPDSTPSPSKKTHVPSTEVKVETAGAASKSPAYVTKSSRVIKKKVIWDPDETMAPRAKTAAIKTDSPSPLKIPQKTTYPKNEFKSADLPRKSAADVKSKPEKKVDDKLSPRKLDNADKKHSPETSKLASKQKKPKSMSEVDKLLGDEGAIKMLYDLKKNPIEEKRRKTVMDVDKTLKDLAKKANQIKSDLVNTTSSETPKSLRKKEAGISPGSSSKSTPAPTLLHLGITRQKSKDSARSSPPPSPGFSFTNETSYLVRRRSSSSISSGEDTSGSLDFDGSEDDSAESDYVDRLSKKIPVSTTTDPLKIKRPKRTQEKEKAQKRAENRIGQFNTFTIKKINKSIIIDLHSESSNSYYFTSELLSELTTALNKISTEKDCNVVLIKSSKESIFSEGLDYRSLISDKEGRRQSNAKELAVLVKDFLSTLLKFPKVLVAGIQGQCSGLAVTMLPLFDIVIASDDATFNTSYAILGSVAEAGFLLTVPYVASYGLAGELLYASQTLTADEACRRGLISRLCWPEKYQDTLNSTVAAVAQGSKQSLEANKRLLRSSLAESSKKALDSMEAELVEHWTSSECQTNFANIE